jgi:hypothetical protein
MYSSLKTLFHNKCAKTIKKMKIKKKQSLQMLPRQDSNISQRWNFSRTRDIIVWLAVADFLASLGLIYYYNFISII